MKNNINNLIFRLKSGEFIKITKTDDNILKYQTYNSNGYLNNTTIKTIKKDIISFSADIDSDDTLHIITIDSNGTLSYSILKENQIKNNILSRLNIKSNKYKDIKINVNNSGIDIFYLSNNYINKNIWTLYHLRATKKGWLKNNVISIFTCENCKNHSISYDKFNNIHLLYLDIKKNIKQINYMMYNSSLNKWLNHPKILSNDKQNCYQPSLFIDTMDNLHALWLENNNCNYILKYKLLISINSYSNNWIKSNINDYNCESQPIILENNKNLYIMFKNNNQINQIVSNDSGKTWSESSPKKTFEDTLLLKFKSNYIKDSHTVKSKYVYGSIDKSIKIFGIYDSYISQSKDPSNKNAINEKLKEISWPQNNINENKIKSSKAYQKEFEIIDSKLNSEDLLSSIRRLNSIIECEIEDRKNIKESISLLKDINDKNIYNLQKLNNITKEMSEDIEKLKNKSFWEKILAIFK